MKSLQRLCAIVVLTLGFSLPALAGDMPTGPGVASPPPAPTSSTMQGDAAPNGHMPTGPGATPEGESFSGVVWGVLEGVLALF